MNGSLVFVNPMSLIAMPQVRTEFDSRAYADLLKSIKAVGVLQPIQARRVGSDLHIVCGHRRTRAAVEAGILSVSVLVTDIPDSEVTSIQLIENLIREDLTLRDAAEGVREVFETAAGGSSAMVCELLSKSKAWVSKMLVVTAPSRANGVARQLLIQDRVSDLEMVYMLCQIEEIDPVAAKTAGEIIETHTRASLKKALTAARLHAGILKNNTAREAGLVSPDDDDNDDGDDDDDDDDNDEVATHAATPLTPRASGISLFFPPPSLDVLMFLRRVVVGAIATAQDQAVKMIALEAIDKQLREIKE